MSCACLIWSFVARKTGPRFFAVEVFVLPESAGAFVFEFCAKAVAQTVSAHASAALSSLFIKVLLLGEVRRRGKRRTFCEGNFPSSLAGFHHTRAVNPPPRPTVFRAADVPLDQPSPHPPVAKLK